MQSIGITSVNYPKSPTAEAFRTLKTNIQFSNFDSEVKTIVITSPNQGEGKSTIAANLACVVSEGNHKTLLMDCDMRKPRLHRKFMVSNETGLTNLLLGDTSIDDAIQKTEIENLYILTCGTRPPNPASIISSAKMRNLLNALKEQYEYIIIDTPPVLPVTDAQILSTYADGCIIVVSSMETEKETLKKAKELLDNVNTKILGIVLNKIDTARKGYYNYYYHSYGTGTHKTKVKRKMSVFKSKNI